MAASSNLDAALATPFTPAKSSSTGSIGTQRSPFQTILHYRKLAGNSNLTTSSLHAFTMDPALKEELFQSQLLDVPGLVQHLFPDALFPIPFDQLKTSILKDRNQWSAKFDRWTNYLDIASTESPESRTTTKVPSTNEKALATFLTKLSGALVRACKKSDPFFKPQSKRSWASESNKPMHGGPNAKGKPDINLVETRQEATWTSTLVTVELKSKAVISEVTEALLQLTNSAYMVFATQDERRFHIGVSFCHSDVRVYIFDRSGVVGSQKFHLKDDAELLIRLVAGLVLTDVDAIGLDSSIRHQDDGTRSVIVAGDEYQLIKTLFISDSIRGRGTVCWQARRNKVDYVIKNTWTDTSRRQTEAEILQAAGNLEGIAHIVADNVVQCNGRDDSTAYIRKIIDGMNEYSHKEWYDGLEVRVHRRLVTTPFAEGLTHFKSKKELLIVFIDAIEAHRRLVNMHILHQDISMGNIMIHRQKVLPTTSEPEEVVDALDISTTAVETSEYFPSTAVMLSSNQTAKGILIDLDSAMITHDDVGNELERELTAGHPTGTLPFMAVEILLGLTPGQGHQAYHDLESFFYVFLWIALQYAGPGDVKRQDLNIEKLGTIKGWLQGNNILEIGLTKYMAMTAQQRAFHMGVTSRCTPYFADLVPCIEELRQKLFLEDKSVKATHQDILDILRKPLAWLPDDDNWSRANDPAGYGPLKRKFDVIQEEDEEPQEHFSPSFKRAKTAPENVDIVKARGLSQSTRISTRLQRMLPIRRQNN